MPVAALNFFPCWPMSNKSLKAGGWFNVVADQRKYSWVNKTRLRVLHLKHLKFTYSQNLGYNTTSTKWAIVGNTLTPTLLLEGLSYVPGWKQREELPFLLSRSHSAVLLWCRWLPGGRQRPDTGTTCRSPTVQHTDLINNRSFLAINRKFVSTIPQVTDMTVLVMQVCLFSPIKVEIIVLFKNTTK